MKNSLAFLLIVSCIALLHLEASAEEKKAYIVYLGSHSHGPEATLQDYELATESHYNLLGSFLGSKEQAQSSIFYSYRKNINGFAAMLDEEEALQIEKHPDVISVFPNTKFELHTTRSWSFLEVETDYGEVLPESIWSKTNYGEDIIIGNLDTGVWPESESFNDHGMGPVPARWKGFCQNDTKEGCNKKLIGARYFRTGPQAENIVLSPRDTNGHGTHTLSTAGGSFVPGANIFGQANGTAKGGSPKARVAAYKVCWPDDDCGSANILAAFEAAIHDGVDVLSVSLGSEATDYFKDAIAIGSFHADQSGISVVCSAGNSGPHYGTVTNVAPWVITVAANTIDRSFPSFLVLGNGVTISGESISSESLTSGKSYPLINAADAKVDNVSVAEASVCQTNSLDPKKVNGKIVVCVRGNNSRYGKGLVVQEAGGIAMVLVNDKGSGYAIAADPHLLPATMITYKDGFTLQSYITSTKSPVAYISKPMTQILNTTRVPKMAVFSSRGPNIITPQILKPDISAPGHNILAAYTQGNSPTELPEDKRRAPFTLMSGTSMSCPHVAGVVGLLKKLHPDWSPAAIRSAILTTSSNRDKGISYINHAYGWKASPLAYGSGRIRPNMAMDPGLVYNLTTFDYLNFLCAYGYKADKLQRFAGKPYNCPANPPKLEDLNYPNIMLVNLTKSVTVKRTLTNVGKPGTYKAQVDPPHGVTVSVKPEVLEFVEIGEEKSFEVTLHPRNVTGDERYLFGTLIWFDGKRRRVRNLIVIA